MSTSAQHFADPGQVQERRLHPRIFPTTLVYVACGAANGGMVLNASDEGMAISMAIAVGGDPFSNVLVRMNGLPQAIEANGRMVWTNASRKRAGIQLLEVNDTQRAEISEWLAYEGVREVHLVPQEVPKIVAPPALVAPAIPVFDESRYSLLRAFGGTPPEFLSPAPSLVEQVSDQQETLSSSANTEMQPMHDFTSEAPTAFRDNEWDLADVTLISQKKSSRAGFPARALIFLWIAIPCLGVGMLVGRRPLDQWLARGDANGENISQAVKGVSEPADGSTPPALNARVEASTARPSAQDAALTSAHVDATNYTVAGSTGASLLPQNTGATLLNSLSTQEVRAIQKPGVTVAAPPQAPAVTYPVAANSKPPSASSFQPTKPPTVVAPVASAPAVAAAPLRKPNSFPAALARDVQPANSASNGPAQQNYDERMPKTLSVDSGLAPRSTTKISTYDDAQPAAPAATAPVPAMTARSAFAPSAPSSAVRSLGASSPNPAFTRPVSPGASPSIAPVLPQPPLHGVLRVARKSDESFVLKLPLESVASDHNTSIRMQRFVMVPKESRWRRRHGPIVKLTIGELLDHDAPEMPHAMSAGDEITVRAFIDKNGAVEDLKPVSGRFALLPRVMRAVREWQFDRTLLDGKPVESEVNVTMEFRPAR